MSRITAEEYQRLMKKAKGATKGRVRGTVPTIWSGIKFDSTVEMRRYRDLWFRQQAGEIADLQRQVEFELHGQQGPILTPTGRVMRYLADAVYTEKGVTVVEDAKGIQTDVFKLKRAILAAMGITVRIHGTEKTSKSGRRPKGARKP